MLKKEILAESFNLLKRFLELTPEELKRLKEIGEMSTNWKHYEECLDENHILRQTWKTQCICRYIEGDTSFATEKDRDDYKIWMEKNKE